jgi:Tfp pilus assembly protein PilV
MKAIESKRNLELERGQSIMEVLIAVAIGALLIIGTAAIIAPVLRSSTQTNKAQAGAALGKELSDNIRVWAEGDWHNISNLATTSANKYYLNTTSSPFTSTSGTQAVTVATTTYTRYFYVDDVSRDTNGAIATSSASGDPSTRKITVIYTWPQSPTNTIAFYVTRYGHTIFDQTDWSGGSGQNGAMTSTNSRFATSTQMNFSTTTGSIIINLP